MSLCDVWVTPAKAMVVVDTEVAQASGYGDHRGEASKMLYLPHANVVIAGRGTMLFLGILHTVMHLAPHSSFDAYAEAMPMLLQRVCDGIESQLTAVPADLQRVHEEQQIALVGYSSAAREMSCFTWESKIGTGFSAAEETASICAPWRDSWGESIHVKTPEHARIMATEQIARALEELPDSAHGGRLMLAELTRADCKFSTLATMTTRCSI